MGHLICKCDNCGTNWTIYHRDSKNRTAKTCPMCGESIDGQTWEKQILPAFGAMEDANRELYKDHVGYHGTLFTVGYEPDVIYPNKERSSDIECLQEQIEGLEATIEGLRDVFIRIIDTLLID